MQQILFRLSIPTDTYLTYYQGAAKTVSVVAEDGKRIEFPAEHLREYVTNDGIYGRFELVCDDNNKFITLNKI